MLPTGNLVFPIRHAGQYYDQEVNLFYNYFRDYDPVTGRYVESDPIGLEGGLNTYGYANANSVMFNDPTGESALKVGRLILERIRKPPTKPDKKAGVYNCAAMACCRGDMDNNCPEDPKQQCKQGVWKDKNKSTAEKEAKRLAIARLGCQPKHVTLTCTDPKGKTYHLGG